MRTPILVRILALGGALAALAVASPSRAQVILFNLGNHPFASEENILLNTGQTGPVVQGVTQVTNLVVDFGSTLDTLTEPSSGQARVEALDGTVNDISIWIPGGIFDGLIINPFKATPGTSGAALVSVQSDIDVETFSYPDGLGSGNNFLTIAATAGHYIQRVNVLSDGGFQDLRQPRISGARESGGPTSVPEPGALALLVGAGISGTALLIRRRA